jgi:hypothetical protein
MELVEIARIAINETGQARIRGAVDIKVPFVVCPEAIVKISACPSSIDRGSGFSGPTLYDRFQARGPRLRRQAPIGALDRTLAAATSSRSPARLLSVVRH